MADTPAPGETVTPPAPKNDDNNQGTPTATPPPVKTEDPTAVEQLRKEKEQAEMRANQLANQLKAKEDAEQAAKDKELADQNKFKDLYEQEKAKREAAEAEREESERQAELKKTKDKLLAEYSDEVKALAEEAGMDLADVEETTVTQFKEKLDKIDKMVTNTGTVGPNNQRKPGDNISDLSPDELKVALRDDSKFAEIISKRPGLAAMLRKKPA